MGKTQLNSCCVYYRRAHHILHETFHGTKNTYNILQSKLYSFTKWCDMRTGKAIWTKLHKISYHFIHNQNIHVHLQTVYSCFVRVKKQSCAFQVNGHLDYMRQMDTILVAVGVPTKEVPGASFALHRPAPVTKGAEEILNQVSSEQQVTQKQTQTEDGANCSEETGEAIDMTGDGWDIPDISDLLDSFSDAECASHTEIRNISPLTPKEEAVPKEISACNGLCDSARDDNKHIMELG